MASLRQKLYRQLSITAWPDEGLSPLNKIIAAIIIVSIVIVTLATEPTIYEPWQHQIIAADITIGVLFVIEYVLRLWVAGEDPEYKGFFGRVKYAFTLRALLDLLAVLPFFLGFVGGDIFLLRLFRLVRIYTLAKLGDFSIAIRHIRDAIKERYMELFLAFMLAMMVLLVSSTVMFLVEGPVQPEKFGSIPRAMWWGIATLTTIGYGDIYPHSALGKFCCSITCLAAIGLIAMPTGIMAAAFSDAFQRHKKTLESRHNNNH
ncbi:MAG: ion transporter [Candidatus Obscuribacterales bacterium]|nr:ion transporter [Candidatus Obscuribacterales bacterium]